MLLAKQKDAVIKKLKTELASMERTLSNMREKWFQVTEDNIANLDELYVVIAEGAVSPIQVIHKDTGVVGENALYRRLRKSIKKRSTITK